MTEVFCQCSLKKKGNSITPAKTHARISQTFSERLKQTKKILPFMRSILEEQQKYLQSFVNNATYHPMNSDADATCHTVIYLVLSNVLSSSFLMFHIIFDEISTTLYNSGN